MRILLLDNPAVSASEVLQCLRDHQFDLEATQDDSTFVSKATEESFDVEMVDVGEPAENRLNLIEPLREKHVLTPTLAFNPKGAVEQLVQALDNGYDDYLGANFSMIEMLARLNALVRRAKYTLEPTKLTAGDISLDLLKRQVRRANKLVELQPREFAMLEFMIRNQDKPLSKLMIMQNVWNYNFDPQTNIVDVLICRLRSKIEAGFPTSVIRTVRGVGYMFTPNKP